MTNFPVSVRVAGTFACSYIYVIFDEFARLTLEGRDAGFYHSVVVVGFDGGLTFAVFIVRDGWFHWTKTFCSTAKLLRLIDFHGKASCWSNGHDESIVRRPDV